MTNRKLATSVLEALECAREHLSDPEHWHKGSYAAAGNIEKCCSLGALRPCIWGNPYTDGHYVTDDQWLLLADADTALTQQIPPRLGFIGVASYNDSTSTTHKDVLAMFDRAIEQLKVNA